MGTVDVMVHLEFTINPKGRKAKTKHLSFTKNQAFPLETLLARGMNVRFSEGWKIRSMTMHPKDWDDLNHPLGVAFTWLELLSTESVLHIQLSRVTVSCKNEGESLAEVERIREIARAEGWQEA